MLPVGVMFVATLFLKITNDTTAFLTRSCDFLLEILKKRASLSKSLRLLQMRSTKLRLSPMDSIRVVNQGSVLPCLSKEMYQCHSR